MDECLTKQPNTSPSANVTNTTLPLVTIQGYLVCSWLAPVYLYVQPAIYIAGLVANTFLIVSVLYQRVYKKSPMFVFFGGIASMDMIGISATTGSKILEMYFGSMVFLSSDLACKIRMWLAFSGQLGACWLLIFASAYRLYGLAFPLDMIKRNNLKITSVLSLVVIVSSFAGGTYIVPFLKLVLFKRPKYTMISCYLTDAKTVSVIAMVTYSVGPGILLFVISLVIVIIFRRTYKAHQLMQAASGEEEKLSESYTVAKNTITALIPMAVLHVVCTVPVLVAGTLGLMSASTEIYHLSRTARIINHSMNFYLQFAISKFYRNTVLPCVKQ